MATFLDKNDARRAQAETSAAQKTAEARIDRERKLRSDNIKRRLAILRLEVETKRNRKESLEREIETLERSIKENEKTLISRKSSPPSSSSSSFQTEIGIQNFTAKERTAKSRVQRDERVVTEAKMKLKNAERTLAESKETLQIIMTDLARLQQEKNKNTGEKKKREMEDTNTKLETSRLKTTMRGKKTLLMEADRAWRKALGDTQALETELRSLGR